MVQIKHCASKKGGMGMDNILLIVILVLSLITVGVLVYKMLGKKKTEKYEMMDELDALIGKKGKKILPGQTRKEKIIDISEMMEEGYLESRKN